MTPALPTTHFDSGCFSNTGRSPIQPEPPLRGNAGTAQAGPSRGEAHGRAQRLAPVTLTPAISPRMVLTAIRPMQFPPRLLLEHGERRATPKSVADVLGALELALELESSLHHVMAMTSLNSSHC